jgi:hypothetical protein
VSASVVLDQQQRNGSFSSGSIVVPGGTSLISASSAMSDADAQNAANHCRLQVRLSYDDGQTWYGPPDEFVNDWVGGATNPHTGAPRTPGMDVTPLPDPRPDSPTFGQVPNRAMLALDTQTTTLNIGLLLGTS